MADYFLDTSALVKLHVNFALELNRLNQKANFGPVTLLSSDRDHNNAAMAEGLAVDDPTTHP